MLSVYRTVLHLRNVVFKGVRECPLRSDESMQVDVRNGSGPDLGSLELASAIGL